MNCGFHSSGSNKTIAFFVRGADNECVRFDFEVSWDKSFHAPFLGVDKCLAGLV